MADKILTFKDLQTWQSAYKLAIKVYKTTVHFPDSEQFGLVNQLRRASVSISSNIAEGFSRQGSKEKIQFYHPAKSSLTEVESQILIAKGVGYISQNIQNQLTESIVETGRLLTALVKSAPQK